MLQVHDRLDNLTESTAAKSSASVKPTTFHDQPVSETSSMKQVLAALVHVKHDFEMTCAYYLRASCHGLSRSHSPVWNLRSCNR